MLDYTVQVKEANMLLVYHMVDLVSPNEKIYNTKDKPICFFMLRYTC